MCGKPEEQVGYLLKSLMHGLRQATEASLREAGLDLSMAHLVTLSTIQTEPGLPGAQLAKRLNITAQSMNAILKQLNDQGVAERQAHPTNQRAHRWFITENGRDLLAEAAKACNPVFAQMHSQLNDAEREQLSDLLRRCIAGLNGAGAEEKDAK